MGYKAKDLRFLNGAKTQTTYRITIPKAIADIMELDKTEYLDLDYTGGNIILSKYVIKMNNRGK